MTFLSRLDEKKPSLRMLFGKNDGFYLKKVTLDGWFDLSNAGKRERLHKFKVFFFTFNFDESIKF